ncbi:hypothetical protein KSB_25280 [Ktedonobacter robiniae]|uniref:Uncharacterized protein n=1 Tax=Ktedonobacter robiniae TaxID=2778365 RepID=A0ABQ3UMY5_9CHLR|nr:hypothetical protein KSB_25280 [Ktedonobacter robiniae]
MQRGVSPSALLSPPAAGAMYPFQTKLNRALGLCDPVTCDKLGEEEEEQAA